MDDIKKPFRLANKNVNEARRDVDGYDIRDDLQYLRVWVSRVRRKLGAAPGEPGRIRTFQGIGYLLDVEQGAL